MIVEMFDNLKKLKQGEEMFKENQKQLMDKVLEILSNYKIKRMKRKRKDTNLWSYEIDLVKKEGKEYVDLMVDFIKDDGEDCLIWSLEIHNLTYWSYDEIMTILNKEMIGVDGIEMISY